MLMFYRLLGQNVTRISTDIQSIGPLADKFQSKFTPNKKNDHSQIAFEDVFC